MKFAHKTGFKNPYRHLRSCYGKGLSEADQDKKLISMYEESRDKASKEGGKIRSYLDLNYLFEYEQAVAGCIDLVFTKSHLLSMVQDDKFRHIFRFIEQIGCDTVVRSILSLEKLVEKRISKKMRQTKGAPLFDG